MAYHIVISCHAALPLCPTLISSSFLPNASIPTATSMAPSGPCVPVSIYLISVLRFFFSPFCLFLLELSKADDSQNLPCFCQFCSTQSSISQYMSTWISSYYLVISPWWKPLNFLVFFFSLFTVNSTLLSSVLWEFSVIVPPYTAWLTMCPCTA